MRIPAPNAAERLSLGRQAFVTPRKRVSVKLKDSIPGYEMTQTREVENMNIRDFEYPLIFISVIAIDLECAVGDGCENFAQMT